MEITGLYYFIYGLCVMFYCMMTWLFWRRNSERISRLVAILMAVIALECVKDLFYMEPLAVAWRLEWSVMAALDMVAVPFYAFILIELCSPGTLTWRIMMLHELPFVMLALMLIVTGREIFYDMEVALAAIYGFGYATWTMFAIPKYHKRLKERFSYGENIDLGWLRIIMISFFIILSLWILDCIVINIAVESVYMLGSLVIWMFICYFIYRHESVIDELKEPVASEAPLRVDAGSMAGLQARVYRLFTDDRIFLNPRLKLSDVADMAGTNRTYISQFFNRDNGTSFFDYVNGLRVEYAKSLLLTSSDSIAMVAERSGFNSTATFHRVFSRLCGCTPAQYRKELTNS